MTVRGGGRVVAASAGSNTGLRFYGVRMLDEGFGADAASETLAVDASWLDATGTDAGVVCDRGSLRGRAPFVTPVGGAFGAAGVVDAGGQWHPHVVIEPDGATSPSGETVTPGGDVPGDGTGELLVARPGYGSTRCGAGNGSCGETRSYVAQENGHQDHSQQDDQAQIHYGNNTGASQDRRRLLDSCLHNAIPAGDSASKRRISLLMRYEALGCDTRVL